MTNASSAAGAPALCSELSSARGLPLIGSAGDHDTVLVFELPPPWTARLVGSRASSPPVDAVLGRIAAEAPRIRVLAVEPREEAAATARVLCFRRGSLPLRAYELREYDCPRPALASLLEAVAFGEAPTAWLRESAESARDLLVCTHGSRDACCGKFGYGLYRELEGLAGRRARVWRCSHLGGHRFAPTMLELPSGRVFGRVSPRAAEAIVGGGEALVDVLEATYRGRCALPEAAQIVEKEMWIECGPRFERASLAWQVEQCGDHWRVLLEATMDDGSTVVRKRRVARAEARAVETPASCGRDPESESPWAVLD